MTDAGIYVILALSAKNLGSNDPTYIKNKCILVMVAVGRLMGGSIKHVNRMVFTCVF